MGEPSQKKLSLARRMRSDQTAGERVLWKLLRGRRLADLKFRRQVPLGPYVVDFLCLRHRLIIESDGPFHDAQRDAHRDEWLRRQGFRIFRFDDSLVRSKPQEILAAILHATSAGHPSTPHPTPFGGHLLPQGEKDTRHSS